MKPRIGTESWMASKRSAGACLVMLMSLVAMSRLSATGAVSDAVERAALLAFKNAQPDPGKSLKSWTGNDPCGTPVWYGIYCKQDPGTNVSHVTEIRAINFNLRGTLVADLGNLARLERLNVINNGLTGQIPPALGKLGNLKLFLVNHNDLTGEIPPELGNLANMTRFQIDLNRLSGSIPREFGNLTKVRHLHMNNNSLSGTIPSDLGRCASLNHLILDYNQISGHELPMVVHELPIEGWTLSRVDHDSGLQTPLQ